MDVHIAEPASQSSVWWSHKFNGPGIWYKVASCIKTSEIVRSCGPFPCNFSNRDIFDTFLAHQLLPGEGVKADSGYSGHPQIFLPGTAKTSAERKQNLKFEVDMRT